MNIALAYPAMNLPFRGSLELENYWSDPRGLTGSEYGFIRLYEELKALGHEVEPYIGTQASGSTVYDAAIVINDPNWLRDAKARVRVCEFYMNDFGFCQLGFEQHVDLFHAPSAPHMRRMLEQEWPVQMTTEGPSGHVRFAPAQWKVNELGCDPERFGGVEKVPGRVIYASSPDRGLHWLLQEWPAIKRAVPHAHLRIFYRLEPWIRGFDNVPYYPSIEPLRRRAVYIEEALRRLRHLDVVAVDSVSREQIAREMSEAEVMAYPCDTVSWSEGFSCSILEACAARACPVITDCDALGELYGGWTASVKRNGCWPVRWRDTVIEKLTDESIRDYHNDQAEFFAKERTWKHTAARLDQDIRTLLESSSTRVSSTHAAASPTSAPSQLEASRSSEAEKARSGPSTGTEPIGTTCTS